MYIIIRQASHLHKSLFDLCLFAVKEDVVHLKVRQMAFIIKKPRYLTQ